jgi:acetyl-CoA C-acetyltransferase
LKCINPQREKKVKDSIVIVSTARTPSGSFQGDLKSIKATELGSIAIKGAVERAHLKGEDISEVLMGCVLPAGLGQGPARQASIGAGIPKSVGCATINKLCGSGMKAIMLGHDSILTNTNSIVVAGGLESMSNAPYLLDKARSGYRLGHGKVLDHMFCDGLEDAYEGRLMGTYAEDTAEHYQFTREQQDAYAIESLTRAQHAVKSGLFKDEIVAVDVRSGKASIQIVNDEQPLKADFAKIPTLKAAFRDGGSVTAANSSSISDGGAAIVLMRESEAEKRNIKPLARILGHASHAQEPAWFTTAPIGATQKLLQKLNLSVKDIDLFEVNEAFAIVAMAAMRDLSIPHEKVNIYGGACALGHPIGASGARIVVTLLNALRHNNLKKGIATLCIGGGEATALGVELI